MSDEKEAGKRMRKRKKLGFELPEPRIASISLADGEALPPKSANR